MAGFASGIAHALATGVSAYDEGQAEQEKKLIVLMAQRRQMEKEALQNALVQAQTKNTLRQAGAPIVGSPEDIAYHKSLAGAEVEGKTAPLVAQNEALRPGKVADATAMIAPEVKKQDALTPGFVRRAASTAQAEMPAHIAEAIAKARGTADYAAPVGAVDPKTGQTKFYTRSEALGLNKPAAGGAGGSGGGGMGQGVQARLLGAVAEARAASQRMDAYENKMLANPSKATPGKLTQLGGKLATRLSGDKHLLGIIGETAGEAVTDPEYLQYMRDAGLMARATQLMSSRGGSEAMVSAEQLLNRAVPNEAGLAGSVAAARKSRNAIFGPHGGLMQALTPDQIAKVEAGLAALEKGESDSPALREAAQVIEGAQQAPTPPPSTPQRRSTDSTPHVTSEERAALKAQGFTDAQINAYRP